MTDARTIMQQMQRPKILIRAARLGLCDYQRQRDLRRLGHISVQPEQSILDLLAQEQSVENQRRTGDLTYSIAHHIDLLIALMSEIRLLPRTPVH